MDVCVYIYILIGRSAKQFCIRYSTRPEEHTDRGVTGESQTQDFVLPEGALETLSLGLMVGGGQDSEMNYCSREMILNVCVLSICKTATANAMKRAMVYANHHAGRVVVIIPAVPSRAYKTLNAPLPVVEVISDMTGGSRGQSWC